jgi:hypothetical protein
VEIAPLGESLKLAAHGCTGAHYAFLEQVLFPEKWFSLEGMKKCDHFEEIKYPWQRYGNGIRRSRRTVVASCRRNNENILFSPTIERRRAIDEEEGIWAREGV